MSQSLGSWLLALDERWSARLRLTLSGSVSWRWLRYFWIVGAHLGDGLVWAVVGAAVYILRPDQRAVVIKIALVVLAAGIAVSLVKLLVRRQRPAEGQAGAGLYYGFDVYAFPSGHACRLFALAALWGAIDPARWWWGWPLALWVACARVALGAHHLADVLAVGLMGLALGIAAWPLF